MNNLILTQEEINHIMERRNSIHGKNQIVVYDNYAEIVLRDRQGREKNRTKISLCRIDELKDFNWYASGNDYVSGSVNGEIVALHRFILKAKQDELVDHINHDKFDNRDENIRICTQSENMMNTIIPNTNTSGFKGVSKHKRDNKWRAYITINKKQIHLGSFDTYEEAVEARKQANKKYQGIFSYPNAKEVVFAYE